MRNSVHKSTRRNLSAIEKFKVVDTYITYAPQLPVMGPAEDENIIIDAHQT